jgi:hypothetical protein
MLTQDEINVISSVTKEQRTSDWWKEWQRDMITASNFGQILAAINRCSYPPSLFKRLFGLYGRNNPGGEVPPSLKHGNENESVAVAMYESITGSKVEKIGLVLANIAVLGCIPDGLVSDNILVEVKCPYKHRSSTILEAATNDFQFCLQLANTELKLKKTHGYYAQVQGSLYITKRTLCHFIIWLENDFVVVHVPYDSDWCSENIPKLLEFYIHQYKPRNQARLKETAHVED